MAFTLDFHQASLSYLHCFSRSPFMWGTCRRIEVLHSRQGVQTGRGSTHKTVAQGVWQGAKKREIVAPGDRSQVSTATTWCPDH